MLKRLFTAFSLLLVLGGGLAMAQTAPKPQCVSGPVPIDASRYVVFTPDCADPKNPIGTKNYVAWLEQHKGEVSRGVVAIFTMNNEPVAQEWIALQKANIPFQVMFDNSELQSVGAAQDKRDAEQAAGEELTGKQGKASTHELANAACTAGVDVLWGTSPANGHDIMHRKVTILFDKAENPRWIEHGDWNYSGRADFEANELNFEDNPVLAAKEYNELMLIHDAMVRQNRPFYAVKKAKEGEAAAPPPPPTTCPALSTKAMYGDAAAAAATNPGEPKARRTRKKDS